MYIVLIIRYIKGMEGHLNRADNPQRKILRGQN